MLLRDQLFVSAVIVLCFRVTFRLSEFFLCDRFHRCRYCRIDGRACIGCGVCSTRLRRIIGTAFPGVLSGRPCSAAIVSCIAASASVSAGIAVPAAVISATGVIAAVVVSASAGIIAAVVVSAPAGIIAAVVVSAPAGIVAAVVVSASAGIVAAVVVSASAAVIAAVVAAAFRLLFRGTLCAAFIGLSGARHICGTCHGSCHDHCGQDHYSEFMK